MSIKFVRLDYWKLIIFLGIPFVFRVRVRPFLGFKKEELGLVEVASCAVLNLSKLIRSRGLSTAAEILDFAFAGIIEFNEGGWTLPTSNLIN
jgi:hypothetical protein